MAMGVGGAVTALAHRLRPVPGRRGGRPGHREAGRGAVGGGPAPPQLASTSEEVGDRLAGREDLTLFAPEEGGGVEAFAIGSLVSATVREGPVLGALTVEHAGGD